MESEQVMSSLSDLVHSSTKLVEQAAPSAQFPPLQRNLDQLEALSKKLKAKTLRSEAPSQSNAATRLLAREGVNAEQLARDLKSFELKTTFEDVFPIEATSIEEYLQQVHEMAMVSAIQEAQKDNLRSFNKYMMNVLQDDWQKEKRDFLQSMSKLSALPRVNVSDSSNRKIRQGQSLQTFTPTKSSGMEIVSSGDKSLLEKKALAYAQVVRKLNKAREHGLPFKAASAFKAAYESLNLQSSAGKSVTVQKIWHLILTMMNEDSSTPSTVSKNMSMVIGARRHLEWGHEKHIMDMIQSHPALAALGGAVGNLQKIRAFLRIRLRDYGILDFDADDNWRQPPVDTTWQQIYYCLRTGYYDDSRQVALSSRTSHHFAPLLTEWINSGGTVSSEAAAVASEECEKMLRLGDRMGRTSYDKKKLLLYAMISASRKQIDRLLREFPTLFNTIEDFLWYKLASVREETVSSSYSLHDLQSYLNKFEPSYYTKNGKDPLVYPYILFLSVQLLPAVEHLSKEASSEHNDIDAVHLAIALADNGTFPGAPSLGLMDSFAEVCNLIRQYGAAYLRQGDLAAALEYYAQAAAAIGGGEHSWSGRCSVDQHRQRNMLLKQLLAELLLRDGGVVFLLGAHGAGEEAELVRFFPDFQMRQQFLLDAARQCQEAGLYDKAIEIYKRVGAFSLSLETINKCLSEAINALSRGRLDGESRITGLTYSGNEILEMSKYSSEVSGHERDIVVEQEIILRQLEAIVSIFKLSRGGKYGDAIREIAKVPFLCLDPRRQDVPLDTLSPHVMSCVPDVLKVALTCLDNLPDTDGSLRAMRSKIAHLLAANVNKNWPRDLYQKVARHL